LRIIEEIKLDYSDVLIVPQRADIKASVKSRSEVSLEREFKFLYSRKTWKGIPIIAANMDTVGTFTAAQVLSENKMLTCIHKFYSIPQWEETIQDEWYDPAFVIPTFGIRDDDFEKMNAVYNTHKMLNKPQEWLCLDVPNGYTETFVDVVKKCRALYPELTIIAGNVATPNMAEQLVIAGADLVKVGIGPGGQCRTRVVTGVGYPQLSANMECSDAVKGLGGWIVADGGCSNSGDIAKALASSDGFVMIGSMLSAHTENTSIDNLVSRNDKMYAIVYGMSSETAMKTHYGEVAKYKSSEGATTEVPYRGKLQDTLDQIFGGLRSTLTYIGTTNLKHLNKRTTFIRVNQLHSGSYDKYKVGN
jgi:GMP reductase